MPDENRFNILYRPNLEPERNYRSEGKFERTPPMPGLIPVPEPTPEDIVEQLKELEELIPSFPEGLEPVGEIVTVLRQRAEIIQAETELTRTIPPPPPTKPRSSRVINPDPEPGDEPVVGPIPGSIHTEDISPEIHIGSSIVEEIPAIPDIPQILPPSTNLQVNVITPKTLVQTAKDGYNKDQLDLQKYFLGKMRIALQKYFQHQLALTAELGLTELNQLTRKYDGKAVTDIKPNDQHLHDTIIRSQVQRDQKARLFKKVANTDQTLMHLRNWNAAEKMRERYYSEAYGDSATFINSEANAILRNNRSEYDNGYRLSLYNTYRYLDSAATITEDILGHTLLESKSKAKLLKDGVDIFKETEVTYQSASQTAVNAITKEEKQEQQKTRAADATENNKQNEGKPMSQMTPEELDEIYKITDPDPRAGVSPKGCHYSKNHIDYLMNQGYTLDAAKRELNLTSTYCAPDASIVEDKSSSTSSSTTTNTATNQDTNSTSVKTKVQNKVEGVTGTAEKDTSSNTTTPDPTKTAEQSSMERYNEMYGFDEITLDYRFDKYKLIGQTIYKPNFRKYKGAKIIRIDDSTVICSFKMNDSQAWRYGEWKAILRKGHDTLAFIVDGTGTNIGGYDNLARFSIGLKKIFGDIGYTIKDSDIKAIYDQLEPAKFRK